MDDLKFSDFVKMSSVVRKWLNILINQPHRWSHG